LDPSRKLATALLQHLGIGAICGAGVIPCWLRSLRSESVRAW
jgi:hypothetical protein